MSCSQSSREEVLGRQEGVADRKNYHVLHLTRLYWQQLAGAYTQTYSRIQEITDTDTGAHLLHPLNHSIPCSYPLSPLRTTKNEKDFKQKDPQLLHTRIYSVALFNVMYVQKGENQVSDSLVCNGACNKYSVARVEEQSEMIEVKGRRVEKRSREKKVRKEWRRKNEGRKDRR